MRTLLALTASVALASCGQADAPAQDETPAAATTNVETTYLWDEAKLFAFPDGIRSRKAPLQRFGTPRDIVEAVASEAYGEEGEQSSGTACGREAFEYSTYGPLRLAYQNDKFAGWYLGEGVGAVVGDTLTVGWPLKVLRTEKEVRDLDPEPGGEFLVTTKDFGQITGYALDDVSETITGYSAGMTCAFR